MVVGTVKINKAIKNECKILLKSTSASPKMFIGHGDFTITIYRMSNKTGKLPLPIEGVVYGLFCGEFTRTNPYKDSETVTREQFDDAMIMCQCHKNSFAETDKYEEFKINSSDDFMSFLRIENYINNDNYTYFKKDMEHTNNSFLEKIVNEMVKTDTDKFYENQLKLLTDWHIIENCGNFKSLTAENNEYFYCFEMITS